MAQPFYVVHRSARDSRHAPLRILSKATASGMLHSLGLVPDIRVPTSVGARLATSAATRLTLFLIVLVLVSTAAWTLGRMVNSVLAPTGGPLDVHHGMAATDAVATGDTLLVRGGAW